MEINQIKPSTVQDMVYEEMLRSILSGRIRPGQRLTLEGVARHLDISLTPVRMALKKLEAGGFISIGKNRRINVYQLTREEFDQILEIRLLNECYAAAKACERRSEDAAALLTELDRECQTAEDSDSYIQANRAFHQFIYSQSGLPMMEDFIDMLWKRVSPYLHILLRNEKEWRSDTFIRHHHGMLEAMKNRDPEAMRQWLTADLTIAAQRIEGLLEKAHEENGPEWTE